MALYIVRNKLDHEFIDGEFNQNSILGIFNTENYYNLFHIVNEAVDAFTTSFVELPTDTGIYFTRGDKISFQPQWDGGEPVEFEGNLIEITENLASFLNEGMEWKIWILKKDKLWWSFVEKPYLLN